MNINKSVACVIIILITKSAIAQKQLTITSPDRKIHFTLLLSDTALQYKVDYKEQTLIDFSSLSIDMEGGHFQKSLRWNKPAYKDTTETYTLLTGKTSLVNHQYKEMSIPLREKSSPFRMLSIIVRVFNDGIAFRYSFPKQTALNDLTLLEESTTFKLKGDPTLRALLLPNYTTSHEGLYTVTTFNQLQQDNLVDMPLLVEYPNNTYMAITEAALLDYAGMYLAKQGDRLVSKLSPLPKQQAIKVKAKLPHLSPWRVLLIGERLGTLIESNIITTLNEPPKTQDWSWIKPGTCTFPWWNGNVLPDTIGEQGLNFNTQKYYIDFCARNNITYHSVVEYGGRPWYIDDGVHFQPGPHADVTKIAPGLDMKQVCDYARTKGVGIRVWVHWAALYPKLDTAFAMFEKLGINGMMVDFMDRDDQEMVNIQTEILEKAAKHHLHIQFHGAYKPTGINRTYPNEFTREGTYNYEVNKWAKKITPDHDLNILFTRALAGSTDYHLGGFRAVPDSLFKVQYTRPLMLGTRCHMLAMYIVLEAALQMLCDYPAAYEGQPGFSLLQKIPTTWDETKVIDAKPGSFACIARRKGTDWYIGAINNSQSKQLEIPLKLLPNGSFTAELFTDAPDAATQPNNIVQFSRVVNANDILKLQMAAGGGAVIVLKTK